MASVFWDDRGIIEYVQQGRTITGAHYVNHFDQLHDAIQDDHVRKTRNYYFSQQRAR